MDGASPHYNIRRLTADDLDWAIDLAEICYRRKLGREAWKLWVAAQLVNPNILILRGDHSIVVAACQRMLPYLADIEGLFPYFMSDSDGYAGELVALMKATEIWMKEKGVGPVTLRPTNGTDATPLAKALGGYEESYPSFRKDLK